MKTYSKFIEAYEEHLMWCLSNNNNFTQEEWDNKKAINFYETMNKYGLSISYCNYEDKTI